MVTASVFSVALLNAATMVTGCPMDDTSKGLHCTVQGSHQLPISQKENIKMDIALLQDVELVDRFEESRVLC